MPAATVIASLTAAPSADRLGALAAQAEILEVRADLFPAPDVDWLRAHFPGRLLYTLRSAAEGGADQRSGSDRRRALAAAAKAYDLVDLERRDVDAGALQSVPAAKRLRSWHGKVESLEELQSIASRMMEDEAYWYKLVNWVDSSGPDRWPLILVHGLRRDDVIAFGGGEIGGWTRLVAPALGSPAMYVAAGERPAAAGQFPIERLTHDFRWPLPAEVHALYGVVGCPVAHSLSPYLFNRALRYLEIPALYVPFHVEKFGEFWLEVVEEGGFVEAGCPLRGLSVTAPDKRIAMAVAGATSPLVDRIGSANTLVFRDGVWEAESTDPEGVLGTLAPSPPPGPRSARCGARCRRSGPGGRAGRCASRRASDDVQSQPRAPSLGGARTRARLLELGGPRSGAVRGDRPGHVPRAWRRRCRYPVRCPRCPQTPSASIWSTGATDRHRGLRRCGRAGGSESMVARRFYTRRCRSLPRCWIDRCRATWWPSCWPRWKRFEGWPTGQAAGP